MTSRKRAVGKKLYKYESNSSIYLFFNAYITLPIWMKLGTDIV